jgi:hypothetical protein
MKWELRSQLKQLHRKFAFTMIYVTHDQTEALTFADKVVVMYEGEIVQVGTPEELFERPEHTFVGYFIGSPGMNVLPVEVRAPRRGSAPSDRVARRDGRGPQGVELGIRPEFVRLGREGLPVDGEPGRGPRPPQGGLGQPRRPRDRRRWSARRRRCPPSRARSFERQRHQPLCALAPHRDGGLSMIKTENNKAWFFVLPVLILVAFNAIIR